MGETNGGGWRRKAAGLMLAGLAAALLPGGSCSDNLGDGATGATVFRVSVGDGNENEEGNGPSLTPSISADGRYVVFASKAKNFSFPPTDFQEIFVRDRQLATVTSVTALFFTFDATTTAMADCFNPVISGNGRYVAFLTTMDLTQASPFSIVPYAFRNVMIRDLLNGTWSTISAASWPEDDLESLTLSDDGLMLGFLTTDEDLFGSPSTISGQENLYVADFTGGLPPVVRLISRNSAVPTTVCNGFVTQPYMAPDGLSIVFAARATDLHADTAAPNRQHIYLSDTAATTMEVVSRDTGSPGAVMSVPTGGPCVSQDGRYVLFCSGGTTGPPPVLGTVHRRDRTNSVTEVLATDAFAFQFFSGVLSTGTSISYDGQVCSYFSVTFDATGTQADDLPVVIRDSGGFVYRPSTRIVPLSGTFAGGFPILTVSGDGRWAVWESDALDQVPNDTNVASDIFGFGPMR